MLLINQLSPNHASVNTLQAPSVASRPGGVLRGYISLAADRVGVGGRGGEMEEEGDLDD